MSALDEPARRASAAAYKDRVAERLADVDVPGAFATSRTTPAADLRLAVKGVGQLRWPLRRSDAQRLIAIARPARYGLRSETRLDPHVRDTWEIPTGRVTVDEKPWRLCKVLGEFLTAQDRVQFEWPLAKDAVNTYTRRSTRTRCR